MRTTMLRFVASVAAVAIILTGLEVTFEPSPVAARGEVADFTFVTFPVETAAVNFWDSWGAKRSGGRRHESIDILSQRGTEVVAVADGVITELGHHAMSGFFIRMQHGHGWSSVYMHLNNDTLGTDDGEGGSWTAFYPTLTEGERVSAGTVIGYVGDSGNAEGTTPHVHFELKQDGEKTNPYPYLEDVWSREQRPGASLTEPR